MIDRKRVARKALRNALATRRRVAASRSQPVCVYDLAEQLGVEVMFRPETSLGGMYVKTSETILIPANRPPGRQAFTCAHELAHWLFGHGSRIDETAVLEEEHQSNSEEQLANSFASYLLMPPWAVREAFGRRNWVAQTNDPLQVFTVAGQLGVGYETLVQHLYHSLQLLTLTQMEQLLRSTPKRLRQSVLGHDNARHLIIVDRAWTKIAVDLQVGDLTILPTNVRLEGRSAGTVGDHPLCTLVEARVPGITRVQACDGSWATYVRVSRRDFIGRSIYRHLEDPDVEQSQTD